MYELAKLAGYVLAPFTLVMATWLAAGLCLVRKRPQWALRLAIAGFAGLWLASMPLLAHTLVGALETRHPAMSVEATPAADAVVLLGGAVTVPRPPERPTLSMGSASSRVWHAAALYRAGKVRWVVVAAGNGPAREGLQVEADAIAGMLAVLGVPPSAIQLEGHSRNTIENATNVLPLLQRLGARRILLVTSAIHMPRAVATFRAVWKGNAIEIIPAATDGSDRPANYFTMWEVLPSLGALEAVTTALKEFAGLLTVTIIGRVTP